MDAAQRAAMGQSAKEYYLAHYRRSELLRKLEHFILEGLRLMPNRPFP